MRSFPGTYHSFNVEVAEATVLIFDTSVHIGYRDERGHTVKDTWNLTDISTVYNLPDNTSKIKNNRLSNTWIEIRGRDVAEHISSLKNEQAKPWYRKTRARDRSRSFMILFSFLGGLVALYFLVVPWMSEKLATRVSIETEEQFGEAVYSGLSLGGTEDTAASTLANQFFKTMDVPSEYRIQISVIKGETINAFALPGGRIVVYDALLKKMESYPELAALLSHEFTHVNNQHSTKSIFRRLGSRIFLSMLLGNLGSVSSVLVDQADNLKSLKYSRRLEKEADLDGLSVLMDRKIDPKGFSDLFRHLKESAPISGVPDLLTSHPDTDKRIAYIQEASGQPVFEENPQLKSIFENLTQKIQQ